MCMRHTRSNVLITLTPLSSVPQSDGTGESRALPRNSGKTPCQTTALRFQVGWESRCSPECWCGLRDQEGCLRRPSVHLRGSGFDICGRLCVNWRLFVCFYVCMCLCVRLSVFLSDYLCTAIVVGHIRSTRREERIRSLEQLQLHLLARLRGELHLDINNVTLNITPTWRIYTPDNRLHVLVVDIVAVLLPNE